MSLFGAKPSRQPSPGYSLIDDRLTIRGELDTDGTVRIDGRVEGGLHRAGTLIVGPRGGLIGNIEATDVVVAGNIQGDVHATGRIEIEAGAAVHGEIRANAMVLREGAAVHGQVSIGAAPAPASTTPTPSRHLEIAAVGSTPTRARG
jgi:cytoskeletal protein CcmA (bactofilin family)